MWVASALVFTIPPKKNFFVLPPHPTAKSFFRARYARVKNFFRGGMRGDNKKKFFGGIVKTKALATHTLYPPTHTSHPEH